MERSSSVTALSSRSPLSESSPLCPQLLQPLVFIVTLPHSHPLSESSLLCPQLLQPLVFIVTLPHSHPLHRNGTLRETKDVPDPWKTHIEWAENRYGVKVSRGSRSGWAGSRSGGRGQCQAAGGHWRQGRAQTVWGGGLRAENHWARVSCSVLRFKISFR